MLPMIYTLRMTRDVAIQDLGHYPLVFLAFLHVQPDGSLLLNNDPISPGSDPDMLAGIKDITDRGGFVMLSIGGSASDQDYLNMAASYNAFLSNLTSLMSAYGIVGVDLDLEPETHPYSAFLPVCTRLVSNLADFGYFVSAPPYTQMDFWQNLLTDTNYPDGSKRIFTYNLQLYGGADYAAWVQGFTGLVEFPQIFLGAGYDGHQTDPAGVQAGLTAQLESFPQSIFAFIWRNRNLVEPYTPADYAQAIRRAVPSTDVHRALAGHIQAHRENLARHATVPITGTTLGSPAPTA